MWPTLANPFKPLNLKIFQPYLQKTTWAKIKPIHAIHSTQCDSDPLLQSNMRSIPLYPLYGLKGKDDYNIFFFFFCQNSTPIINKKRAESTIKKARSCDKAKKN